jgi:hypothetical protein
MVQDITPTGDDFYIVYEDAKKTSYLIAFLTGINRSGKGGVREATVKYPLANINTFSNFEAFNNGLIAAGQPAMTWDPYIEDDPAKECNQDNDGNCT